MITCFELNNFSIKLEQHETQNPKATFKVTYGLQVRSNLEYGQAAKELGECIFHALACDGKLIDSTD